MELFDLLKTSEASGSLVAATGKIKHHYHLQKSFNRTTYILAKLELDIIGNETVATTYSCGEYLMPIIQYSLNMRERSEVFQCLIIDHYEGFSDQGRMVQLFALG